MEIPESIQTICDDADKRYPKDRQKSIFLALARIKELPEFNSFVETLLCKAIQEIIYEGRCRRNQQISSQTYNKVNVAGSASVRYVYESVYLYRIGGSILGDLTGEEIEPIIESENGIIAGHQFNIKLLKWLREKGVVGTKKVKEVVTEKELREVFEERFGDDGGYGTESAAVHERNGRVSDSATVNDKRDAHESNGRMNRVRKHQKRCEIVHGSGQLLLFCHNEY